MFALKNSAQKQKTHVCLNSGNVGFGTFLTLFLSPETPLARDGRLATRSVARTRTTDRLAADTHEVKEYVWSFPMSNRRFRQKTNPLQSKNQWSGQPTIVASPWSSLP
jgi:hypothetical protein